MGLNNKKFMDRMEKEAGKEKRPGDPDPCLVNMIQRPNGTSQIKYIRPIKEENTKATRCADSFFFLVLTKQTVKKKQFALGVKVISLY